MFVRHDPNNRPVIGPVNCLPVAVNCGVLSAVFFRPPGARPVSHRDLA
jgi:hypothetical protein